MDKTLSHAQLSLLSELIAAKMGLYFTEARWHDLERGLGAAARAGDFADLQSYCHALIAAALSPTQVEELSHYLTIGETYFFREKPTFQALREFVLPELIRARRMSVKRLRMWSAGCCTGEEAYSLSILLHQLLPDLPAWSLSILATDINTQFLHKAQAGVYGEWSFRDIPPLIKEHFFTPQPKGRYEILPTIKAPVHFTTLNLAEESYPTPHNHTAGLDLILCRNVLMYFSPAQAKRVVRRFYDALAEGGWLVVSLGETSHQLFADFAMVEFPNAILYQKRSAAPTRQVASHTRDDLSQSAWPTPLAPMPAAAQLSRRIGHDNALLHSQPIHTTRVRPPRPESHPRNNVNSVYSSAPGSVLASLSHPAAAPATLTRSEQLYAQGDFVGAEAQARREVAMATEAVPGATSEATLEVSGALRVLASVAANQGHLDEALVWCVRAVEADRLNLRGHYLQATIHQARGQVTEAVAALQRALYVHPEFVLAHFMLGYLARQQGKRREAEKHFATMFTLLQSYAPDAILPESDGLTAGRLGEMVRASMPDISLRGNELP